MASVEEKQQTTHLTEEEYLASNSLSPIKREFIEGRADAIGSEPVKTLTVLSRISFGTFDNHQRNILRLVNRRFQGQIG